jgi:microcystin degradation protein MlrC
MAMMSRRILFAGLFHETHTFLEGTTGLSKFQVLRGEEMLRCAGNSSPLGGALECAEEFGWEVLPTVDFRASPSAMVEDDVVESFGNELNSRLRLPIDGVFLVLHGAMVSQSHSDVEGLILERLRRLIGLQIPIFGVFDLHANFSQRMADNANCLVAYRQNPHTDARDAAQLATRLLQRSLISGELPRMVWQHPPLMWPPTGTGTSLDPMRSLEEMARAMELQSPQFWTVNVCAGFAFADCPDTGVSFAIATTGSESEASVALARLSSAAMDMRRLGNVIEPSVEEVFKALLDNMSGLTVLVESSDNIGGGAPGDGTGLLRALVQYAIPNAAMAINDPAAVLQLCHHAIGTKITLPIGGHSSRLDAGPLMLEVELIRLSDGEFELEDKQSHLASMHGDRFDMGRCAVVRHGGLTILLTSHKTPPFDLAQWRSQGLEPTKFSVIAVKAAVAHRRAYDPIADRMLWVNTPGPCTSNLASLPYRRIKRPIFPLDECLSLT